MALVTLLVNFNTVQDDTRKEAESIISAARLMGGLKEASTLKRALVRYAKSIVDYDLVAMCPGSWAASLRCQIQGRQPYPIEKSSLLESKRS